MKYLQLAEFGPKACGGKVTFQQSELAADITAVHSGKATKEYEDASAFYDRTFITGLFGEFRGTSRDLYGRGGCYLNVFPSKSAVQRFHEKLRQLLKKHAVTPLPTLIGVVNRLLLGWRTYFDHGYPRMAFRAVNHIVVDLLIRSLRHRSQRPYRPPAEESYYGHLQRLDLRLL